VRDLLVSYATTGAIQAAVLVGGVLSARLLLPEGRGELFALLLWPQVIASLSSLSLGNAVNWRTARSANGSADAFFRLIGLGLPFSALGILVGWILIPTAMSGYDPELVSVSRILLLILVPSELIFGTAAGQLLALGRVVTWNLLRLLQPITYSLIAVCLWLGDAVSAPNFALAYIAGGLLNGAFSLALIAPRLLRRKGRLQSGEMRHLLVYALSVHLGALLVLGSSQLDRLVLSASLPAHQVGLYAVALSLVGGVALLAQVPNVLVLPKTAAQASGLGQAQVMTRYVKFTLMVAGAGAIALVVLAEPLLTLLFGADYRPAASVLRLLAVAAAFTAVQNVLSSSLQGAGRPGDVNLARGAGLATLAVGLAVLVSDFGFDLGIMGAGAAMLVAAVVQFLVGITLACHRMGIPPRRMLVPDSEDVAYLKTRLGELRERRA
jgi:O-antigen/teichoic acid export membrane protein